MLSSFLLILEKSKSSKSHVTGVSGMLWESLASLETPRWVVWGNENGISSSSCFWRKLMWVRAGFGNPLGFWGWGPPDYLPSNQPTVWFLLSSSVLSAGPCFPMSLQLAAVSAVSSGWVIEWMSFAILAGESDWAKAIVSLYNEFTNGPGTPESFQCKVGSLTRTVALRSILLW